jgi:hypothetical protein
VSTAGAPVAVSAPRARRLRAPLLITVWTLLGVEALGGLVLFFARLAAGSMPGETLHVAGGAAFTLAYAIYQWQHWSRVAPWRGRLDYVLGLIAALAMGVTLATGYALAWPWWNTRMVAHGREAVAYPVLLVAAHNIMSMLVLTFVASHLAAVLLRDAAARRG